MTILRCILFILLPILSLAQENNTFLLTGKVIGKDSDYVYLWYPNDKGQVVSDSCLLINGVFHFSGTIDKTSAAIFSTFEFGTQSRKKNDDKNITELFLEPRKLGFVATINHFKEIKLSDSYADRDRVELENLKKPVQRTMDSLCSKILIRQSDSLKPTSHLSSQTLALLDSVQAPYYPLLQTIDSNFILDHPDSWFAADLLWRSVRGGYFSFASIQQMFDKMPDSIQKSKYGERIEGILDSKHHMKLGSAAFSFSSQDNLGNWLSLDSLKGKKYILLDFWASWCGPCRQNNNFLGQIYNRFKNRLELISIAGYDNDANWKKAIRTDHMDWPQILDSTGTDSEGHSFSYITDLYHMSTIPTLILINKDLMILGIYGGGGYNQKISSLEGDLQNLLEQ